MIFNPKLVKVGCDPEFFVKESGSVRKMVSAHGLVPGTKDMPHKVHGGAIQVDGMAVEFNTDPTSMREGAAIFSARVTAVIEQLKASLGDKYDLVNKPWSKFSNKVWKDAPDEAKILGCEPDFNAYTGLVNKAPNCEVDFRTAAGHLHIGWCEGVDPKDQGHIDACKIMIRELDIRIGLLSVLLDPDKKRRELYGRAGAFRPKSYGVEYRTPSNFWVGDRELEKVLFSICVESVVNLFSGSGIIQTDKFNIFSPERVEAAINESNKTEARNLTNALNYKYRRVLEPLVVEGRI